MAKVTNFFKGEKLTSMQYQIICELLRESGVSAAYNLSPTLAETIRKELALQEKILHKNDVMRQVYVEQMNETIERVRESRKLRSSKRDVGFFPADGVQLFHFDD